MIEAWRGIWCIVGVVATIYAVHLGGVAELGKWLRLRLRLLRLKLLTLI